MLVRSRWRTGGEVDEAENSWGLHMPDFSSRTIHDHKVRIIVDAFRALT
jgi:hypothetical protein